MMPDPFGNSLLRRGGPQPLVIIILILVLSFQAGYSPDETRQLLSAGVLALVAVAAMTAAPKRAAG